MTDLLRLDVLITAADRTAALRADVQAGLFAEPRSLRPAWFYDHRGSELFDDITRLPEYYLTRTEHEILSAHAKSIVAAAEADTLVELGAGTSTKTRILLDAMVEADRLRQIVLLDVSEQVLADGAAALGRRYGVPVHAIVGDFTRHLSAIPPGRRRLWVFLGSTIGNFTGRERSRLLFDLEVTMDSTDHLLLGADLVKPASRLLAAYDDSAGVTAEFNRNVLNVLNHELGADFDPTAFAHVAAWNDEEQWIEMRLEALRPQRVTVPGMGRLEFAVGEQIRTEVSAKFQPDRLAAELWAANLVTVDVWSDPGGDFLLSLLRPYC